MINIRKFLNLTYYTSELDQFLAHYRKHLSATQRVEKNKYNEIFKQRDEVNQQKSTELLFPDNF